MPIRTAVSPRAWMTKGDVTWKAPSAAAPFMSVRRLNFAVKAGDVMSSPPMDFLFSSLAFRSPGAASRRASYRLVSGRPLYLAAGGLSRTGGLFAGHRVAHREHIVRIALRRMRFADEYGAHQLMVAGAICRRTRLQGDFRRQLESGKRARQLCSVERFFLIGNHCQRLYRRIAEPVARGGGDAGDFLDRGIEFRDVRHARLIPPPSDARPIGHRPYAFELEQGAAHGHLLVQTELNKLFEARDLIAAAHDIDE